MDTLTWNEAVDQALEPTDLDRYFSRPDVNLLPGEKNRIGEDGKLNDYSLVRERATRAYVKAHKGEEVEVNYADPKHVDERTRAVWRTHGTLTDNIVSVPTFIEEGRIGNFWGLQVGDKIVPVSGITAIRTKSDHSVVTL